MDKEFRNAKLGRDIAPACWASVRDAERHVRAQEGTVRAAINRGDIPAYRRPGKRGAVIVDLRDVDAWVRDTWEPASRAELD
ncbi:MAG: hypothetical protein IKF14_11550 [Atopobiaceae bacterium]|nr:hypothetical protein [Atopobiaceae bacterium]